MKIALIAPSPIPYTMGGAEKLWFGIYKYINENTNHQCELIKIPVNENSFWGLIDSYYDFFKLDLSYFDMVISGKYPAWMVNHHNHHLYMLHCLRGFYDCFHFLNILDEIKTNNDKVKNIVNQMSSDSLSIRQLFELVYDLKNEKNIEKELFDFPGAFIRKIVMYFDKKAMENIVSFSSISKTVASRKEYFPLNQKVNVIYPPSTLDKFHSLNYDYFFIVSRLDNAKRIDIILKAYLKSKSEIPLVIAGTGPLEEEFKELTKDDKRINFVGFLSDTELTKYYANAYSVIFVPYDEDYGLITIEAMMSNKPVITFNDSGGVLEFVENNKTGVVCKPNVNDLKRVFENISNNKDLILAMGKNAKEKVSDITWNNLIDNLLNNKPNKIKSKKITIVSTYAFYPPRGGGQNRIFYLYKELAKVFEVEIICLVSENEVYKKTEVAKNLFEVRIPKTEEHAIEEWNMQKKTEIPITDIAMLFLYEKTPQFIKKIIESCNSSFCLITIQPYLYPLIEKYIKNIPIIQESQNVEYELKKQMLKDNKYNSDLLDTLYEVEKKTCKDTFITTICSKEDEDNLTKLYDLLSFNTVYVPNGVDLNTVPFINQEQRIKLKKDLNLENENIIIFIGSYHQPNIEAVKKIINFAKNLTEYKFIIIGSVCKYFENANTPLNLSLAGIVSDIEKEIYLSIADIALNPMLSGSGTNLKMLDYMASGIPVITTKIGSRGLYIPDGYIVETSIDKFEYFIKNINGKVKIRESRKYVEEKFSWPNIVKKLSDKLSLMYHE